VSSPLKQKAESIQTRAYYLATCHLSNFHDLPSSWQVFLLVSKICEEPCEGDVAGGTGSVECVVTGLVYVL